MKRSATTAAKLIGVAFTHIDLSSNSFGNAGVRCRGQILLPHEILSCNMIQDNDNDDTILFRRDFSPEFQSEFEELMHWRRDVRHFRTDWDESTDEPILHRALSSAFRSAPSVGLSEPWRIVRLRSSEARNSALANFEAENAKALEGYEGDKKLKYASLKLSGMKEAPVQIAVFCDDATAKGSGLGARTMPEMRRYSVVGAITLFWLAARCVGLGVGWVSVLDPMRLGEDLEVPEGSVLVGYLCVGWPEKDDDSPELERLGWEKRMDADDLVVVSV